jgi:membrane-associated phospholipid phosphatase
MRILTRTLNQNLVYFIGYIVFVCLLSVFCLAISKSAGFLLINRLHSKSLDYFFILFTNLGNVLFVIGLMVFMGIRKKFGWSLQIGVSFLVSGLLVQVIKHLVNSPRPKLYFGPNTIHFIYGITRTGSYSFPSGHTATIFALTTLLSLYFTGRKSGLFFIAIAVLTGFSRIYLSQHFPIDILVGSGIGFLISVLVYRLIPLKIFEKKFPKTEWERQSVTLR